MTQSFISSSVVTVPFHGLRSLQWSGDALVDVLAGTRVTLAGVREPISAAAEPHFDGAVSCGDYTAVFERLGTRGQLLHQGRFVRELSRDPYRAEVYDYPIAMWQTRAGRTLLAHCPESYCCLEIEDAETGRRLTASEQRKPGDFFHARLQVNPSRTRLLSAGWVWHPFDFVGVLQLARALEDPCVLDEPEFPTQWSGVEESSAAWLDDDRILLGASTEPLDEECAAELGEEPRLRPGGIALFDLRERRVTKDFVLGYPPGAMMPVGPDKVLTLFEYPRLVSLVDGSMLHAWPELPTGCHTSSIIWHLERGPAVALDSEHSRFAVARGDEVVAITLGCV